MLVYGGVLQDNTITGQMLNLDLDYYEWSTVQYKQIFEPLAQAKVCTVVIQKRSGQNELVRMSDEV